ncbi:hypothetical protein HY745_02645 [Candidatus Desantisbacteria bacterium]|nr:hypothetical protein [Candidatus Desantisbacteria bacterium]
MNNIYQHFISNNKQKFKQFYQRIPEKNRKFLKPIFWVWGQFQKIYLPAFKFHGKSKLNGIEFVFIYAGSDDIYHNYFAEEFFSPGYKKEFIGYHLFWNIRNFMRKNFPECILIFVEFNIFTNYLFKKQPSFKIPSWLEMEIDISLPMNLMRKLRRSGYLDIQRHIRKYNLNFEVTTSQIQFENFYYNMHLPYIKKRHLNIAIIDSYSDFMKICKNSELFIFKKENETAGGMIVEYKNNGVFFRRLGIENGNEAYLKAGIIGAAYYFTIIEMQKKGYKKINIGGTRAFLNNGLTKYKLGLSAYIFPHLYVPCEYTHPG